MAIRYDEDLLDEIRRTVKNYQDKRRRVLAKGGNIIPDPAYVSTFLNDYTNRRALVRDLKKLQRYSVRGAEETFRLENGVLTSNYEYRELKRLVANAKRQITKELKSEPDYRTAQPITQSYYDHLRLRYQYLEKPIKTLSRQQFKTFMRIAHGEGDVDKRERTFRANLKTMIDSLLYGVPKEIANNFRQALSKLNIGQISKLVQTDPYMSGILDYYHVFQSGGEVDNYLEILEDLTQYINAL